MIKHKQTKVYSDTVNGNCLATSLACLLDINISDVPEFEEMARHDWKRCLKEWLCSLGLAIYTTQDAPKGFAIAVGWSPRGVLHAVVVKDGAFYHDPSTKNEFLVKIRDYWFMTPVQGPDVAPAT